MPEPTPDTATAKAPHRPRVVIDAPTRTALAQVSVMCWFLYGLGPMLLLVRDELHLSRAETGLHSSMVLFGGLSAGLLSPGVVRALGRHRSRSAGLLLLAAGCVSMSFGHIPATTLAGAYICGVGLTTAVNALNPSVVVHHGEASASALSLLNAVGATLGVAVPLVMAAAIDRGFSWRHLALLAAGLALLALTSSRSRFPVDDIVSGPADDEPLSGANRRQPHGPAFRFLVFAVTMAMLVEYSTNIYAVDLLHVNGHLDTAAASAYAATFIAGFAGGRWLSIPLALRISAARLGLWAALVCVAASGLLTVARTPLSLAAALFVLGIGTGPGYPVLVSGALAVTSGNRDKASALIAVLGGGGAAIAPFTLGYVADRLGISAVFAVLSGTAALSASALLYAMFYDRWRGGAVPAQRNPGV